MSLTKKQRRRLRRILVAAALLAAVLLVDRTGLLVGLLGKAGALWASFALYLVPYLVAGHDVLRRAWANVRRGDPFDECLLMSVATIGAFAMVAFPGAEPHMAEGAAVMLLYQVGELFQSYAVGRSRQSVADLMDIAPQVAHVERDAGVVDVDPSEVRVGEVVVVRPGERVALDGTVVEGTSHLDTAALTGESAPRDAAPGAEVVSGCVSLDGMLRVRATRPYSDSTVSRILELVEGASDRKARTEGLVTRFARVYTPLVVLAAALLAVVPPLLGMGAWSQWVLRGLTFLVVSCPCALVISVPLSFFGGIGGASRAGVLVKGANYLEALARTTTVVFDKTGTLTTGSFEVESVECQPGVGRAELLDVAAHAEAHSGHPIAQGVRRALGGPVHPARATDVHEVAGQGVSALVDGRRALVGSAALMASAGLEVADAPGDDGLTVLHVAYDGRYLGCVRIADAPKPHAADAVRDLRDEGVSRCEMLTGDREGVARRVAGQLGLDGCHAQLLPAEKVACVEALLADQRPGTSLAFVGDGINDAPVLMRADVGVAMGALGSDAAIEAADVVLMDDDPRKVAVAIRVARRTMRIAWQNIVFAIGVKLAILALAAVGAAGMWLAVFGDVGVAVLAILNATRAMRVR